MKVFKESHSPLTVYVERYDEQSKALIDSNSVIHGISYTVREIRRILEGFCNTIFQIRWTLKSRDRVKSPNFIFRLDNKWNRFARVAWNSEKCVRLKRDKYIRALEREREREREKERKQRCWVQKMQTTQTNLMRNVFSFSLHCNSDRESKSSGFSRVSRLFYRKIRSSPFRESFLKE